jgi:hypothetical protein
LRWACPIEALPHTVHIPAPPPPPMRRGRIHVQAAASDEQIQQGWSACQAAARISHTAKSEVCGVWCAYGRQTGAMVSSNMWNWVTGPDGQMVCVPNHGRQQEWQQVACLCVLHLKLITRATLGSVSRSCATCSRLYMFAAHAASAHSSNT